MFSNLIKKARSYRRFDSTYEVKGEVLRDVISDARNTPSAGNRQRVRFAIVTGRENCAAMRANLGFAAYLKGWGGPKECECPTAYIVLLSEGDADRMLLVDMGITAEAIVLSATEKELGACIFASFKPDAVREIIGTDYTPTLVIAIGKPL